MSAVSPSPPCGGRSNVVNYTRGELQGAITGSRRGHSKNSSPNTLTNLQTIQLWFQLLDHASEREVSDSDYMFLADRFTAWVARIGEPKPWPVDNLLRQRKLRERSKREHKDTRQ